MVRVLKLDSSTLDSARCNTIFYFSEKEMLDVKGILCSLIHNNTVQDMVSVSSFSSSARASIDEALPPSSHKKNFYMWI